VRRYLIIRIYILIQTKGIKEYSEWPTIPQLYVDKEFVGGCDILVAMHQNGELAKMLEEKKVFEVNETIYSSCINKCFQNCSKHKLYNYIYPDPAIVLTMVSARLHVIKGLKQKNQVVGFGRS
jgi:hypothetical protein